MSLKRQVKIARRFLRSINIGADLGEASALEGFICPQSSAEVLLAMARHVGAGQHAFTWTGPYGSGKSSLVVALSALLNGNTALQKRAEKVFGRKLSEAVWKALPPGTRGWRIVPVVGRRETPAEVIGEALVSAGVVERRPRNGWSESALLKAIVEAAAYGPKAHGGLVIFVDEMGKFLEGAAQADSDIYIFQLLAELAARSNGRLLVVGILHQAFEEYAHRLKREMRDEWAKIQGRFVDLAVNTAGEEQIDLISRAIETSRTAKTPSKAAQLVASLVRGGRSSDTARLAVMLESCWPLNPVVACLLGPISRRRFGQNQRSIFGFLNSAEPHGFQDFLHGASEDDFYEPHQLWDYLRANLEPSILASPDGHRWALAADAMERCEAIGGDALHVKLLKTIAVIDLFKERSGLVPSLEVLSTCFPDVSEKTLKGALDQLSKWSFTIYKKFLDAHAIYAGSDFDIDAAVRTALEDIDGIDFDVLKKLAGLQPVLAKRHYHDTGAMRWFEINISPLDALASVADAYRGADGAIGQFVLAIPTNGESEAVAEELCREGARHNEKWDVVVGLSQRAWTVVPLARELLALDRVQHTHLELQGDEVARREVEARLAELTEQLELELRRAFDGAIWYRKNHKPKALRSAELNGLASELADRRYDQSPRLNNELLNRQKPSSSAVSAQNTLLKRMVLNEGEPRLGIEGFPAEGGLFASVLEATGLYRKSGKAWQFMPPRGGDADACGLGPLWQAATSHIKSQKGRAVPVSELYGVWREPPYGVKDGLMPILAVAFILSNRETMAAYRDGAFRPKFDDVDTDYLAKDAGMIQLRWMNLSEESEKLLAGLAKVVRDLDRSRTTVHLEPLEVARGLVAVYEQLPQWTKRTMRLSQDALRVRELFKRAKDPNQFLFDDIPAVAGAQGFGAKTELRHIVTEIRQGLGELSQAYGTMLHGLRDTMLAELQVTGTTPKALADLRARAENIRQLVGDFHLDAFIGRLSQFNGSDESFEGIASLAANKPPRDWVDPDLDRATVQLADFAQQFLRAETFARVKGRTDKRHAMAVVIGMNGRPSPILEEFQVAEGDRHEIDKLVGLVAEALAQADTKQRSLILAALAEISTRYMDAHTPKEKKTRERVHS
jgi:hypothetical protein